MHVFAYKHIHIHTEMYIFILVYEIPVIVCMRGILFEGGKTSE
jgi:hypothetical protein